MAGAKAPRNEFLQRTAQIGHKLCIRARAFKILREYVSPAQKQCVRVLRTSRGESNGIHFCKGTAHLLPGAAPQTRGSEAKDPL